MRVMLILKQGHLIFLLYRDPFPNLKLNSADGRLQRANDPNNTIYPDITTTWQLSRDGISWSDISESPSDRDKTTFRLTNDQRRNSRTPGNAYYMDDDIFIRVKIEEGEEWYLVPMIRGIYSFRSHG